jgi:hypothetical protein
MAKGKIVSSRVIAEELSHGDKMSLIAVTEGDKVEKGETLAGVRVRCAEDRRNALSTL